uniref:LD40663p n=1 Tax=Drosophila melanogaster TaxID=7227 RepID=Q6NQZ7_DROME|eukprot:NP_001246417.1 TAK1-associated binding protein 2, isoform B [Drosophila melanogaster]
MAATPPMPPGSNTHQLNGKTVGKGNPLAEAINQHFQRKKQNQHQSPNPSPNPNPNSPASRSGSYEQLELLDHATHPQQQQEASSGKAKPSCHCTNISIMHLFHEMKQEFPTIPDAIVTQCVNENCHQRENCIQMLRKELALHPIPVQSYPAKVLQQQQQQHHQNRQAKPPTPLKPSRIAPPQPEAVLSNGVATPPGVGSPHPDTQPRPRPTTLNLQRQFSTQLQQKIMQRQQRQQRDHQPAQLTPTSLSKPLRRAPPLPPPPKPKPGSFSNDSSCLTSPMSSSESELSLNAVPLSSPTSAAATAAAASAAIASTQQQPSPVRHRSVITLQPEPPYARDFRSIDFPPTTACTPRLPSPSSAASPSAPGGRKSFTSLNLTLRQPTGSAQSAIDITAGPAPSGQGSGITYSSVSFDARRGTQKNFQLTVTDEGSVFSAGSVRPRTLYATPCEPVTSVPANQQPPPPAAVVADGLGDADMTSDVFPYPTQEQNHIVASNYSNNHAVSDNNNIGISNSTDSSPTMPLYEGVMEECDREARAATIERQKQRRDKLANALRDNKKRLLVLEQEINILTEPVPVGESERLDRDIKQLTEDCNRLLDCLNEPQANGPGPAANPTNRQHLLPASNASQQQPQQQPQPFPRQRQSARVQAPPSSLRLHSVPAAPISQPVQDFGQHHSSAPTSACLTPQMQSQQQLLQLQQEPPPTYAQYYQFQQYLQQQRQQQLQQQMQQQQQLQHQMQQQQQPQPQQEEEFLSDSDVDEEEETLDSWACNMCTFRNHPQLNICEACENVRIQPGMIRIVPSGGGAAAAAATPPGSIEQQQQPSQQPYALHT